MVGANYVREVGYWNDEPEGVRAGIIRGVGRKRRRVGDLRRLPRYVKIIPIDRVGARESAYIRSLASTIRTFVLEAVSEVVPWSNRMISDRVRGNLLGTNRVNSVNAVPLHIPVTNHTGECHV